MRKVIVSLIIGVLSAFGAFFALNWDYTKKNVAYTFRENKTANILKDPNIISIPSLQISAPVKFAQESSESEFQKLLKEGVVHFPNTALAGQSGNVYIFGHSSDYPWSNGNYKAVFALLPKIKVGDQIFLNDSQGVQYKYVAIETKIVLPSDLTVLNQDRGGRKLLSVQTSYPVGTALKRFIAIAELVQN